MDKNYGVKSFISKYLFLRKSRVANIADIIKVVTTAFKTTFTNSKKVKSITNNVLKCDLHLYFLIQQKLLIFSEKALISAELKVCVTKFIYFLDLL